MSLSAVSAGSNRSIWGSAANALTTPTDALAAFKPKSAAKLGQEQAEAKPAKQAAAATQDGLRQLQEAAHQAGAFSTDIMQALRAYGGR